MDAALQEEKQNFEIEIKLPVQDLALLKEELCLRGFAEKARIREKDQYYNGDHHNVKDRGEALRIRESTDLATGASCAQINFKGRKIDNVSMSRPEYETQVQDGACMGQILKALGFLPVAVVTKTRCYLERGDMTACLDQVEGLGAFLELEIVTGEASLRETALQEMEQLLTELGLSMNDTVRTSYLGLLSGEAD